jgi:hypothetical protein
MIQVQPKGKQFFHLINTESGKVVGFAADHKRAIYKAKLIERNLGSDFFVCRTVINQNGEPFTISGWGQTKVQAWQDCIENTALYAKCLEENRKGEAVADKIIEDNPDYEWNAALAV